MPPVTEIWPMLSWIVAPLALPTSNQPALAAVPAANFHQVKPTPAAGMVTAESMVMESLDALSAT